MTSRARISELPTGSQTEGGEIAIVQGEITKKQTIGTAATRDAGTSGGDVPILNSSGAVALAQGGTGLTTASPPANSELSTDASGVVGWNPRGSGGGGGSVAYASEKQFTEGTATAYALNPAVIDSWRDGVDRVGEDDWAAWATTSTSTANAVPVDGGSIGGISVYNNSSRDSETATIPVGELRIFGPNCTNLPTPTSGTFAWGLGAVDGNGVRWMIINTTADGKEAFRLNSGSWVSTATTGAGLAPAIYSLPNTNRWYATSVNATGAPTTTPFFAKRNGGQIDASWITRPSTFQLHSTNRQYDPDIPAGAIGTAELANGAVSNAKLAAASVSTDRIQDDAVTLAKIAVTNDGTDGQALTKNAQGGLTFTTITGGGGSTPADGSVTYAKMAASAIATEQDIFDDPSSNSKLVANKTLSDALEERDQQLGAFWGAWIQQPNWTFSSINNAGYSIQGLGSGVVHVNTSSFDVRTGTATPGNLYVCGLDCVGEPNLTSGTLRGGLMFVDTENIRWFYPIDNPESPDDQEFFKLVGGSWIAEGYKGDGLRVHLHGLMNDSRWNPFAAHSIGGPGSAINVFNDETAIARRVGNVITLVRATYSTADNDFTVSIANQVFTIPLTDGQVSTAKLANGAVGASQLKTTNTGSNNQMLVKAGESFTYQDVPSGGSGVSLPTANKADGKVLTATGTGSSDQAWEDIPAPASNSLTTAMLQDGAVSADKLASGAVNSTAKLASAIFADEEDVLDASSNNRLIGNATLKGIIEDISSDHLYGDWSAATQTNHSTLPNPGLWTIPNLGGDGQMAVVNGSIFNAQTANIGSGRPNLFGPLSSGLPNHSGTQRGAIVILDDSGTRWALPIANVPDAEATYELVSGAWVSRGYRGDELRIDFARIRSDSDRYEVFSSLALHGPTAQGLVDEVLLARSDGRSQYALRVGYSTSDSRYEILTAKRDAIFNLRDGEVTTDAIAANAVTGAKIANGAVDLAQLAGSGKAAGKIPEINSSNNGIQWVDKPSGGGGGTQTLSYTEEKLDTIDFGSRVQSSANGTQTLDSGKSFADWDFVKFKMQGNFGGTNYFYYSNLFSTRNGAIGANNELLDMNGVNIDLKSNTTWAITSGTISAIGITEVWGCKYTLS